MFRYYMDDCKIVNTVIERKHIYDLMNSEFIDEVKKITSYHEEIVYGNYDLDLHAKNYYQDYNKWWIIALYNNIIDPFEELSSPVVLKIPNPMELDSIIADRIANKELK